MPTRTSAPGRYQGAHRKMKEPSQLGRRVSGGLAGLAVAAAAPIAVSTATASPAAAAPHHHSDASSQHQSHHSEHAAMERKAHHMHSRHHAGKRIVRIAKRYAGNTDYEYGGSTPQGFDCSGFTHYVYKHAHVSHLQHNADRQQDKKFFYKESSKQARPGDLIFYHDGGHYAYHVAIYLGHHRQVSAVDEAQGVKKEHVWSHHVTYQTDWHH